MRGELFKKAKKLAPLTGIEFFQVNYFNRNNMMLWNNSSVCNHILLM